MHGASGDVCVFAGSEGCPGVARHDAQATGRNVEGLVGVLVVMRGWSRNTRRCHYFDGGDASAHGQQRHTVSDHPERPWLVGVDPYWPFFVSEFGFSAIHLDLR